jgi:DNA-binding MarR family transcriptional regulator
MNGRQARPGPVDAGPASARAAYGGPASVGAASVGPAYGGAASAGPAYGGPAAARAASARAAAAHETGGLPPLVSAWRSLAARHAAVSGALEHELGQRHGLGVSEFEVLERLVEDEQHKLRVQELAESVHLSQSTLSRLIGRLEQHGLVQRNMCDADRRGIDVCLTQAGRQRHAEAQPTQRAVLAATLHTAPNA